MTVYLMHCILKKGWKKNWAKVKKQLGIKKKKRKGIIIIILKWKLLWLEQDDEQFFDEFKNHLLKNGYHLNWA